MSSVEELTRFSMFLVAVRGMSFEYMDIESRKLIDRAEQSGVILRTVGSLAIWQRLSESLRSTFQQVRNPPKDIDFLAPSKRSERISQVFQHAGYIPDERLIAWHGKKRHRYFQMDENGHLELEVDVFLGVPPSCHAMEFEHRLDAEGPAMKATDLLLQKLQIVETGQKDLIDICFLFLQHDLKETEDDDSIAISTIVSLLNQDWGFYYTTQQNLQKVRQIANGLLEKEHVDTIIQRIDFLSSAIETAPKTMRWRIREKIGTRMQWYNDVEEVDR